MQIHRRTIAIRINQKELDEKWFPLFDKSQTNSIRFDSLLHSENLISNLNP